MSQKGQNKRCLRFLQFDWPSLGTNISKIIMPRELQFIAVIGWCITNTQWCFQSFVLVLEEMMNQKCYFSLNFSTRSIFGGPTFSDSVMENLCFITFYFRI